jgi:hypothetical protein
MFDIKLSVTQDNTRELKKALKDLERKEILVGFPEEGEQRAEPGQSNAYLAFINDQGSPAQNIPARPFMIPGVESAQEEIVQGMHDAAVAALNGNPAEMDVGFHKAGLAAQAGIKNVIASGVPPALSPVTIMQRQRRGIRSTKQLVATGQMFRGVQYVIVNRKH